MKVCLLDSGGILFANVTEDTPFFERLGQLYRVDSAFVRAYYEARDAEFELGMTTGVEVVVTAIAVAGVPRSEISPVRIRDLYRDCLVPNKAVFDVLLARGRGDGFPLVALANNEARDWEMLKNEHFGHLALFDVIASSWALKQVKPTATYFKAALAASESEASNATFVDDNAGCVAAAMEFGLHAVHFDGVKSLIEILEGDHEI